jgi:hypothetical protein
MSRMTKIARKTQKRMMATLAAPRASPVKPIAPAISAMTRKIKAHSSIPAPLRRAMLNA